MSARSIGDIWLKNGRGEWNPINVKTGLVGSEGQPNIVSLKRVMSAMFERKIDSYYLLMVKFMVDMDERKISHRVHFVDMLDWMALPDGETVITYNAGPGQSMLKAKRFFELLSSGFAPERVSIRRKMELLMELFLLGERNLLRDRRRDRKVFKAQYDSFMDEVDSFSIDLEKQKEFLIR